MNNLLKLLRFELLRNKNAYVILASIIGGAYFIHFIWMNFIVQQVITQVVGTSEPSLRFIDIGQYRLLFGILVFVAPFMMYKHLFNSVQGVSLTMLPASSVEKFAVMLIQCVVFVPVLLIAVPTLLNIVVCIIGNTPLNAVWFSLKEFFASYLSLMVFQAIAIWGVLFFKQKKLWKTVLTVLCTSVFLSITASIITFVYFSQQVTVGQEKHVSVQMEGSSVFDMLFNGYIIAPLIILALYVWGYFKMLRQQM
ncbi:MAG: hypothetical protein LBR45_00270 [Bacteroidales bacterium]|jgi:hypothetical protein|nr:hypothetical protein [Bacteroidales bacterium]